MKNIAIIFGGVSTEHEISISSATSVIENMNKKKYKILPIYIDKTGNWYKYKKNINDIKRLEVGCYPNELEKIDNVIEVLKKQDLILPILHGKNGEDGSIQGFLEVIGKKYVGCKILSSSLCMDKVYTKMIINNTKINQAKYIYLKYEKGGYLYINEFFEEKKVSLKNIDKLILEKLNYPVFIKPSRSGSSIGISKVYDKLELKKALDIAIKYDNKILIEENIIGKEIECAVLEENKVIVSTPGEIITDYYTYEAKYENDTKVLIPACVNEEVINKIKEFAIRAFKAVDATGLARIDFFVTEDNKIYLNEINTMPGFTDISMYPKLFFYDGISYSKLIDKLLSLD